MSLTITFQKLAESTEETQILSGDILAGLSAPLTVNSLLISSVPRILVLIDSTRVATTLTGLRAGFNSRGYVENETYFVTGKTLDTVYSGAGDLDEPYAYNIVFISTNGGSYGSSGLGTRLNAFLARGNHLVMMTFCWNIQIGPLSFNYTVYSPYTYSGAQSIFGTAQTLTADVGHPITNTALSIGTTFYNSGVTLASGAQNLATYSNGQLAIAVRQVLRARIVGLNFVPDDLSSASTTQVNRRNLVINSILWCVNLI